MSKAFTSEETEEPVVVVPARAPLPPGATNYVTPAGHKALLEELRALQQDRAGPEVKGGRIAQLEARVATATVVDPKAQPRDEVRFGATVKVENDAGVQRSYQIVGVDEACARLGKIAFTAPLARALSGLKVNAVATLATPRGDEELTVISIAYW